MAKSPAGMSAATLSRMGERPVPSKPEERKDKQAGDDVANAFRPQVGVRWPNRNAEPCCASSGIDEKPKADEHDAGAD